MQDFGDLSRDSDEFTRGKLEKTNFSDLTTKDHDHQLFGGWGLNRQRRDIGS